jgi:uncharacterized damage-inducible protein DinB
MQPLRTVDGIQNPYTKRILTNVIGKDAMKVLASTPQRLPRLVKGLTAKQLRQAPVPGKWSIAQIVCHLSDTEAVFAFRLRMVVAQSGCPIQAMDEQKWASGLGYERANVGAKVQLFTAMRKDHLTLLKSLKEGDFERFGMHEERGKETIERMVQMYAGHDINHLGQIELIRKQLPTM